MTIDGTYGVGATGTIQTDAGGELIGEVTVTGPASGYKVGETVSITDSNGIATATVQTIA